MDGIYAEPSLSEVSFSHSSEDEATDTFCENLTFGTPDMWCRSDDRASQGSRHRKGMPEDDGPTASARGRRHHGSGRPIHRRMDWNEDEYG